MLIGDFVLPDPPQKYRRHSGRTGEHLTDPCFISSRIKARGHVEWTGDVLREAATLWRLGKNKPQIAAHFAVTLQSIVGMIYRNRALFPKRG